MVHSELPVHFQFTYNGLQLKEVGWLYRDAFAE
jgi:hypothetical protein